MLYRELEEAKARAAQMEKTMRWWSDCTANWREKWCEVRDERNKAKKETKLLKSKLEAATKDLTAHKQESHQLEQQNAQLRKEMERLHSVFLKHVDSFDPQLVTALDFEPQTSLKIGDDLLDACESIEQTSGNVASSPSSSKKDFDCGKSTPRDSVDGRSASDLKDMEEYIMQGAVPKMHQVESPKEGSLLSGTVQEKRASTVEGGNEEVLMQKMSMLNLRLEEATKTISAERE